MISHGCVITCDCMALMPTHCPFKSQQRSMKLCSMVIQIISQHLTFDIVCRFGVFNAIIILLPPWLLLVETSVKAISLHSELSKVIIILSL